MLSTEGVASGRRAPKRFAPLNPDVTEGRDWPKLKGIVFDVDGTLCKPQNYMFQEMRTALGITKQTDILDHIHSLPQPAQDSAQASIRAIESAAMLKQEPQPGLLPLITYLESRSVRMALCTRNFNAPVTHLLQKFLPGKTFSPIVTREFRPPKPDPAGILFIAREWGLEDGGEGLVMVGDSVDDVVAGYRAGAATVLLGTRETGHLRERFETGLWIDSLDELIGRLEEGLRETGG